MSTLKPFINIGPGETIREELEYYGWEQKDFAEIMGRTEKYISQLITNKAPVTYEAGCLQHHKKASYASFHGLRRVNLWIISVWALSGVSAPCSNTSLKSFAEALFLPF